MLAAMRFVLCFVFILCAWPGRAAWVTEPSPSQLCRLAIASAERSSGVPDRLMRAIGIVESGRRDDAGAMGAWPWTINAEGVGYYYATKAEAIASVNAFRARGVRSIDVGCMQVNLFHHGDAFNSLEEAFDPGANARYAARFLLKLFAQTGSWPGATAGYHSLTPEVGEPYARKVLALWQAPDASPQPGSAPAPFAVQAGSYLARGTGQGWSGVGVSAGGAGSGMAMGYGSPARIIRLPTAQGAAPAVSVVAFAGGMGRGLDSYRSNPTIMVSRILPNRG